MPCTGGTHRSRLSPNISTCLLQEAKKANSEERLLGKQWEVQYLHWYKKSIPCSCGVGDGVTVFFFSFCLKGGSKKPRRNTKATRTVRGWFGVEKMNLSRTVSTCITEASEKDSGKKRFASFLGHKHSAKKTLQKRLAETIKTYAHSNRKYLIT